MVATLCRCQPCNLLIDNAVLPSGCHLLSAHQHVITVCATVKSYSSFAYQHTADVKPIHKIVLVQTLLMILGKGMLGADEWGGFLRTLWWGINVIESEIIPPQPLSKLVLGSWYTTSETDTPTGRIFQQGFIWICFLDFTKLILWGRACEDGPYTASYS